MNNKPTLLISKVFLCIKNLIIKNKYEFLPKYNKPNTILAKVPIGTNRIIQLRVYDCYGRATLDIDFNHHKKPEIHPKNMPNGAHKHIWDFSQDKHRGNATEMTLSEYNYYIKNINKIDYQIKYVRPYKNKRKNLYNKNL